MDTQIYLYWSKTCDLSRRAVLIVNRYDNRKIIKCLSIENLIAKNRSVPRYVTHTPTILIIRGNSLKVIEPKDVISFLGEIIGGQQSSISSIPKSNRREPPSNQEAYDSSLSVIENPQGFAPKRAPIRGCNNTNEKCSVLELIPHGSKPGQVLVQSSKAGIK